jgi:hypothetical protein
LPPLKGDASSLSIVVRRRRRLADSIELLKRQPPGPIEVEPPPRRSQWEM